MARILYLSSSDVPSTAANAVAVMKMCEALAGCGHEVVLIAARGERGVGDIYVFHGVAPSFRVVRVPRPRVRLLGQLLYAAGALVAARRIEAPDLLYARDRLLAAAARRATPLVHEVHEMPGGGVRRWIERRVLARPSLARVVVISRGLLEDYRRAFPRVAPEKILVAPSGAGPGPAPGGAFRPPRSGRPAVGYLGHFHRGKGIETVVELARRRPDVDVFAVGGDAGAVRRWREETAGVDNLRLLGPLPPSEGDGFRRAMDVLVAPYAPPVESIAGDEITRWLSPLKIAEYMAAGRAIIASDLPPVREMLEHEVTGVLVPPADLEAWERALDELVASPEKRERLGRAARARWAEAFSWRGRAARVLEGLVSGAAERP